MLNQKIMDNILFRDSVIVNNNRFVYEVDRDGYIWVTDPITGSSTSFDQYRPIRNREDAKQAALDIITNTGVFVKYL